MNRKIWWPAGAGVSAFIGITYLTWFLGGDGWEYGVGAAGAAWMMAFCIIGGKRRR